MSILRGQVRRPIEPIEIPALATSYTNKAVQAIGALVQLHAHVCERNQSGVTCLRNEVPRRSVIDTRENEVCVFRRNVTGQSG